MTRTGADHARERPLAKSTSTRRGTRFPVVLVAILSAALIGSLIFGIYRGLITRQADRELVELAYTESLGASLEYILIGVESNLVELANGRVVDAYFANAALGLTLEYGLRISLLDLEVEFDRHVAAPLIGSGVSLSRLVLIDDAGDVVLDSNQPRDPPGRPWDRNEAIDSDSCSWITAGDQIVIGVPCRASGRVLGRLIAFLPTSVLHDQLQLRQVRGGETWLVWNGGKILPRANGTQPKPRSESEAPSLHRPEATEREEPLWRPTDDDLQWLAQYVQTRSLSREARVVRRSLPTASGERAALVSVARTNRFPLSIVRVDVADKGRLAHPETVLVLLVIISIAFEALFLVVWRVQVRVHTLGVELEKELEHRRLDELHTQRLEGEIERRRALEHQLRTARDAAEAASQAKSFFLANISHEIRTPLNGLLTLTELVLDSDLTEEQTEYLEIGLASGRALLVQLQDLLDAARIDSGRLTVEQLPFDLIGDLTGLTRFFQAGARTKGLRLDIKVDPRLAPRLIGDPLRIRQVLTNLLGNAIKFTDHGRITVEAEPLETTESSQRIEFRIRDTGCGIPPEAQGKIFGAFQQADPSSTRQHGGAGLGLYISQDLVRKMGGQLVFQSIVDEGSIFSFQLNLLIASNETDAGEDGARRTGTLG